MTKLAQLISEEEGFSVPGSIPARRHNPGDLRHSPHSTHPDNPNDVGTIDTDEHGWADLERQLGLYAARGFTVRQMVDEYAPPCENNTSRYLDFICRGLGVSPETLLTEALTIPA